MHELASHRITRVYRKMVKMGRAIDDDSPAEDLHELRKVGKELRYLLEFFSSLYPADVVKPFIKTLKGLQDQLGRFQDREVQANALRDARARRRSAGDGDGDGRARRPLHEGGVAARAEFADRFAAFASKAQRAHGQGAPSGEPSSRPTTSRAASGRPRRRSTWPRWPRTTAHRTLLWDLDPQGASTYLFRIKPKVKGGGEKLVRGKTDVEAQLKGTDTEGLDLLPADFSYRHMDLALDGDQEADHRLRARDRAARDEYEYTFLDCPPSISLVSESVFEAADALLVPIIPATLSSRTLEQLHERARGQGPAGARLLLDGRPPQAAAPRADGRARRASTTCSRP